MQQQSQARPPRAISQRWLIRSEKRCCLQAFSSSTSVSLAMERVFVSLFHMAGEEKKGRRCRPDEGHSINKTYMSWVEKKIRRDSHAYFRSLPEAGLPPSWGALGPLSLFLVCSPISPSQWGLLQWRAEVTLYCLALTLNWIRSRFNLLDLHTQNVGVYSKMIRI